MGARLYEIGAEFSSQSWLRFSERTASLNRHGSMSNCYLEFYFELPLPSAAVAKEVSDLLDLAEEYRDALPDEQGKFADRLSVVFSEFAEYEELGFNWNVSRPANSTDEKGPWMMTIEGEESGNVEHATELVQWLLPDLDIDGAGFEYACYGGGENSGGAVAVVMTEDGPKTSWMNTSNWLAEKLG